MSLTLRASRVPHLLRRLSLLSFLSLAPVLAGGCADLGATTDDVTNVQHTPVKDQSIGNCWVYASVGWAESLRLSYSGTAENWSESWVSYWHWYEGILGGKLEEGKVATGGFFGEAAEIMRKYGLMTEGSFIPEEAESAESSRQSQALAAINASLASGALKDPAARKDKKLVRAELDKAWKLDAAVVSKINAVFGESVSKNLTDAKVVIPDGMGLRRPVQIEVGLYVDPKTKAQKVLTLADAIGLPASTYDVKTRTGEFAWTSVNYPSTASARRNFLKRMQDNLHRGFPVVMTWFVDFNAFDRNAGTFAAPPATIGRQGGHMTTIEDYQINNVPGYGTLKAGETVTDPKILEAALATEAKVEFIRVKNSWGSELSPPGGTAGLGGYHDLYLKYLDGPIVSCEDKDKNTGECLKKKNNVGLWAMVFPTEKWKNVTFAPPAPPPPPPPPPKSCAHDLCTSGTKLAASCDPCVELICSEDPFCCSSSWDAQCVSTATYICDLTCK